MNQKSNLAPYLDKTYKHGFITPIESETLAKGLNEDRIREISAKKKEPDFILESRLKAFRYWKKMPVPQWAHLNYPEIDFQNMHYYASPKKKKSQNKSLNDLDPELIKTFNRLGIPTNEQKRLTGVAVDVIFDSISIANTHKKTLEKVGVIFCSMSEAIQEHPKLIQKYLGTVVPYNDNFYATLNSAVFTDGSFCYIPKGCRCPIDLSTYFRINAQNTGQFERTLIIAEEDSYVNYLEGCTAPQRDENQLHAAIVEILAFDRAEVHYSTVQNWYSGNALGKGGVYNFVTKRGKCVGKHSRISWTQVEAGSAITWKYPSVILQGDNSSGAFYSVALTHDHMQADTGTKMIHIGKNTKSTIISKGISLDQSSNSYRGKVAILRSAKNARNYSQCDSMLVGNKSKANTYPYLEVKNKDAILEHEASTSRISEEQLVYFQSRGLDMEKTISILINGFCNEVFKKLPLEFSVEAVKLIEMKLENSVG